jgi:two-component system, chemotaxis family, chemotaxis protein CheY
MIAESYRMSTRAPILVVEDDEAIRELITTVLADEGYDLVSAENGAAALDVINVYAPRLILLDMRMPVMDGWGFASAYRQREGQHAPIVVLTAARDAALWAADIKADDFLAKPFALIDLLSLVSKYVKADMAPWSNGDDK